MLLARLVAVIAHEIITEFRGEWERLSEPDPILVAVPEGQPQQQYDITGTTGAQVERPASWDHDQRKPVVAARHRFGFTAPESE